MSRPSLSTGSGTGQHERQPPLLRDDAIGLDERSLAQLIDSCARHASLLRNLGPDGRVLGTLGDMLARDDSVWLARLACLDIAGLEAEFLAAYDNGDGARMRSACEQLEAAHRQHRAGLLATAGPVWEARLALSDQQLDTSPDRTQAPGEPAALLLRGRFYVIRHLLGQLQEQARAALPASLDSGSHEPATALLLAGLRLLQAWQQRANRLHGERIDFYYQALLGQQPRTARPGRLHLVLRNTGSVPVDLPAGTRFGAGADAQGRPLLARADTPLQLSDAEVLAVHTLRQVRDPRISPERAFGAVSDLRLASPPVEGVSPDQPGWPLLGAEPETFANRAGDPARVGLAIASPLLRLAEGDRHIRLQLCLTASPHGVASAIQQALDEPDDRHFPRRMGAVLTCWLFSDEPFPDDPVIRHRLRERADRLHLVGEAQRSAADPLCLLSTEPPPEREAMRHQLLQSAFEVWISSAGGWWQVDAPRLKIQTGALVLEMTVPPRAPPLVPCSAELHGTDWPTGDVLLRLEIGPRQRMHALSLLDMLQLAAVEIEVGVEGLRQLELHYQLGRLDPGRPFAPFGPLPDGASHLILGAPELTHMPLTRLGLHLHWSGLPATAAQLQGRAQVPASQAVPGAYGVTAELLHDGRWQDDDAHAAPQLPLFSADDDGGLAETHNIELPGALLRRRWRTTAGATASQPYGSASRSGYVRLRLSSPAPDFFGHGRYPQRLTEALSHNARGTWQRGLRRLPLPQPPYTPTLERLTISYAARRRIELVALTAGSVDRLYHRYPLGLVPLRGGIDRPGLLPELAPDGHLLIGLRASRIEGRLSLLFELDAAGAVEQRARAQRRAGERLSWSCWDGGRWCELHRTAWLADGTGGLLASGVIVLDLPDFAPADVDGALPAGLHWLRLASDAPSSSLGTLRSVRAQALTATREGAAAAESAARPLAGWQAQPSVAAVGGVTQPLPGFGHAAAEDQAAFRTRIAERLRHRGRACQPWDYERLVLAELPEVARVLCLPACVEVPDAPPAPPGGVRLYVVPRVLRNDDDTAARPASLPVATLARIEGLLRPLASPHAAIAVHGALFERLQVRCLLQLQAGATAGQTLQAAQRLLRRLLSPWCDESLVASFGWTLRRSDLARALRELPGVLEVSGLSVLHYGVDALGSHWLHDSAAGAEASHDLLRPRHPGSLALSAPRHLIQEGHAAQAQPSGLQHLTLGQTLIVR